MATPTPRHPSDTYQSAAGTCGDPVASEPNPDSGALLYTPAEAAQLLRVRESWLRKKAAARDIPCTFLGKHLRFSPTDLTAIITAASRPAVGRRPRRRPASTRRDRDLPPPPDRSVHAHHDDHDANGSTPWRG